MADITRKRLKNFRETLEKSQQEMALLTGMNSQANWGHLESGRTRIGQEVLEKLVEVYPDIDLNYFFKESVTKPFPQREKDDGNYPEQDILSLLNDDPGTIEANPGKYYLAMIKNKQDVIRDKEELGKIIARAISFSPGETGNRALISLP